MSGAAGAAAGEVVETLRFFATDALNPLIDTSFRGATVTRTGVGLYTVNLNPLSQVDVRNRTVHVDPSSGGIPGQAWERGGTDGTVLVGTAAGGQPADTGDGVTVTVIRSSNTPV